MRQLPKGSWIDSAKDYVLNADGTLRVSLKKRDGQWSFIPSFSFQTEQVYVNGNGYLYPQPLIESCDSYEIIDGFLYVTFNTRHKINKKKTVTYLYQSNVTYSYVYGWKRCPVLHEYPISLSQTWIVLLTWAIRPNTYRTHQTLSIEQEMEFRQQIYQRQLTRWLNETPFSIVVIESTGSILSLPNHSSSRLTLIQCNLSALYDSTSSSFYEAKSILYAMERIPTIFPNATHILKVTGRYYLDSVIPQLKWMTLTNPTIDLCLQHFFNISEESLNTEYYGIRMDHMIPLMNCCLHPLIPMEKALYKYRKEHHLTSFVFHPFFNDIPRGGDNQILNPL